MAKNFGPLLRFALPPAPNRLNGRMPAAESAHVSDPKKENLIVNKSEKVTGEKPLEERNGDSSVHFIPSDLQCENDDSEEPVDDPEEEIEDELEEDSEEELDGEPEEDPEEEIDEEPEEDLEEELDDDSTSHSIDGKGRGNDPEEELDDETDTKPTLKSVSLSISCLNNDVAKSNEDKNQNSSKENVCNPYSVSNAPEKEEPGESSRKQRRSRWGPKRERETAHSDGTSKRRKTRWDMPAKFRMHEVLKSLQHDLDPESRSLKMQLVEINSQLQSSEIHDERPTEERSPSPEPVYNNLGIRINTRESRLRKKLIADQRRVISKLVKTIPSFKTSSKLKSAKLVKKLYVPVKEYPDYKFVGLILGPRGSTIQKMEKETGAKIFLRGIGTKNKKADSSDNDDLHVLVEAGSQRSLDAAVEMVKKLLVPVADGMNDHKKAQLEELAKLRGNYVDKNMCSICKEQGHQQYACPRQESTFKAVFCDFCGSFSHLTSNCNLRASSQICKPLLDSSGVGSGSKGESSKPVDDASLYVGYLPQAVVENQLKELFSPFGKIIQTTVIKDRSTGLSKGYGFVKFENSTDAAAAVAHMNGYKMDGKMLAVRVTGQKPAPAPSQLSHLPILHAPAALPPNIPGQMPWFSGPPVSVPPHAHAFIPNNQSLGFPPSSIYFGHYNNLPTTKVLSIPPSSVSSITNSRMAGSFSSTPNFLSQMPSSSHSSFSQFPGDPDYPGSQFKSYFSPPTVKQSPAINFSQNAMTDQNSISWSASHFP